MTRQDFKNKTLIFSLKIVSDKIKIPTSLSRFWNHQTWTRVNINPQTSMSQNHHEVRSFKMYYHQVFIDLVSASQDLNKVQTSAKSRFAVTQHPLLNPHLQRLQHVSSKASVSLENVSSQESLIRSWKEKNRCQTQNDCSTVTKWSQWHQWCWICQLLSSTLQFVTFHYTQLLPQWARRHYSNDIMIVCPHPKPVTGDDCHPPEPGSAGASFFTLKAPLLWTGLIEIHFYWIKVTERHLPESEASTCH